MRLPGHAGAMIGLVMMVFVTLEREIIRVGFENTDMFPFMLTLIIGALVTHIEPDFKQKGGEKG